MPTLDRDDSPIALRTLAAPALALAALRGAARRRAPPGRAAQPPAPRAASAPTASTPPDRRPLAALAWLDGCWSGTRQPARVPRALVPLRGGMLIGVGHNGDAAARRRATSSCASSRSPTASSTSRLPSGQKEAPFKLDGRRPTDDGRRSSRSPTRRDDSRSGSSTGAATEGWLYATIEGKLNGEDRQVIYPLRRVDCETGELIRK